MRRGIGILLLSSVLALLLAAACWGEEIVLDFPSWAAGEPPYSTYLGELADEFNARHEGVARADLYYVPYAGYLDTMLSRFAAGDPPDIFHIPVRDVYAFVGNEWLEDLTDVVGRDVLDEWTPVQQWCNVDGENICVMVFGFGSIMGVNRKLFEDAGLAIPTNMQELLYAATQLSKDLDGDGVTDQWGLVMSTMDQTNYNDYNLTILCQGLTGERVTNDDGSLNADAYRVTLAFQKALLEAGATPPGMDLSIARELWIQGKAAMIFDGPWVNGFIENADESVKPYLDLDLAPSTTTKGVAGGVSNAFGVPTVISSEKKQLVFEFIQMFAEPYYQAQFARITRSPAARQGVLSDEELATIPYMSAAVTAAENAVNWVPLAFKANLAEYRQVVIGPSLAYLYQGMSLDDAVEQAQEGLQQLLEDI